MKNALLLLALLFPTFAAAQQVQQSGNVTPGHPVQWSTTGVIQDAGPALNGKLTGVGVTNSGLDICQNSGPITGTYTSVCLGFVGGLPTIAVGGNSGATALNFNVNGNTYSLPGIGTGNVSGPTSTVVGDVPLWANTSGSLLEDGGTPSALQVTTGLTGSVARPLSSLFTDKIEALDYGCAAVVNTSADATPCINATLAAAVLLNRVAHFPGGVYTLLTQPTVPTTGFTEEGDGWDQAGPTSGHGTWFIIAYTSTTPFNLVTSNKYEFDHNGWAQVQPAPAVGWTPTVYPPIISAGSGTSNVDSVTLNDNFLFGVYDFARIVYGQRLYVNRLWGEPFHSALDIQASPDVVHINDEHYWPFWLLAPGVNASTPAKNAVINWQTTNGIPLISRRNDNPEFGDYFAFGYHACVDFDTQASGPAQGITSRFQFSNLGCDASQQGIMISGNGVTGQISNLDHDGADFTSMTNAPLNNSYGIYDSGTNALIDIVNFRDTNVSNSVISLPTVNGDSDINITNLRAELWSQGSGQTAPALFAADGNVIKLGGQNNTFGGTAGSTITQGAIQSANVIMPTLTIQTATTLAAPVAELTLDGTGPNPWNNLNIPFGRACTVAADVTGRDIVSQDVATFHVQGLYERGSSGNAALVGQAASQQFHTSGAAGWAASVVLDTTTNNVAIQGSSTGNTNQVDWQAFVTEICR